MPCLFSKHISLTSNIFHHFAGGLADVSCSSLQVGTPAMLFEEMHKVPGSQRTNGLKIGGGMCVAPSITLNTKKSLVPTLAWSLQLLPLERKQTPHYETPNH